MSKTYRIACTKSAVTMPPKELKSLQKDKTIIMSSTYLGSTDRMRPIPRNVQELEPVIYFKDAVVWKGAPEQMVPGVKVGIGKCIALSRAAIDTTGVIVGPKGLLIPRKGARQKELAPGVKPMTPEEKRAKRRKPLPQIEEKARVLGVTIPALPAPA